MLHEILDQKTQFTGDQNKFIKMLIKEFDATIPSGSGATALHYAVRNGHSTAVKALLDKKEKLVEIADLAGRTPLHEAVDGGRIEIVQDLLAAKASPFVADKEENTPFYNASGKDFRIVELLIKDRTKEQLNAKDSQGRTALYRAVSFNVQPAIVKLLIDAGVDPQGPDNDGRTLLHNLAEAMSSYEGTLDPSWDKQEALQSFEEVARLLLSKGVNPSARDSSGKTALDLAQGQYTKAFLERAISGK